MKPPPLYHASAHLFGLAGLLHRKKVGRKQRNTEKSEGVMTPAEMLLAPLLLVALC